MAIINKPVIWYFADPMCSWCWGFSPVFTQLQKTFSKSVTFSLNLGGLRPGTKEPISNIDRDEILHHWRSVHKMTGQPFKFENAMLEGFIYDTEPPSRAVTLMASLNPKQAFTCFDKIQTEFYQFGKNVTQISILKNIMLDCGVSGDEFNDLFEADNIKQATQEHFRSTYQAGIRGFPAMVWQVGDNYDLLCSGYLPFDKLSEKIKNHLAN